MKRIRTVVALLVVFSAVACEKDDLRPLEDNPKNFQVDCKDCPDNWDLTDTVP